MLLADIVLSGYYGYQMLFYEAEQSKRKDTKMAVSLLLFLIVLITGVDNLMVTRGYANGENKIVNGILPIHGAAARY